jgi:hypothetical protein
MEPEGKDKAVILYLDSFGIIDQRLISIVKMYLFISSQVPAQKPPGEEPECGTLPGQPDLEDPFPVEPSPSINQLYRLWRFSDGVRREFLGETRVLA